MKKKFLLALFLTLSSCGFSLNPLDSLDDSDDSNENINSIDGDPSQGSSDIYASANLKDICVDDDICGAPYTTLPSNWINTDGQEPLTDDVCNFDYDPNYTSTFTINRVNGTVNGLELVLSKEDLFFLAWVSMRLQINPYFLMGVMSQESAGNCAAVSGSHGEGCFQITNTFGQAQLDDSYPDRVIDWNWSDRSGDYYPDDIFIDEETYFGDVPDDEQFRVTTDPTAEEIDGTEVSSVINFPHGVIASGLYFKWQQYLLYTSYEELGDDAEALFQAEDGKASWQAAAYNGGAYGAANAIADGGSDFLEEMADETQDYVPLVLAYCKAYQAGGLTYNDTYTEDDVQWLIDLLSFTYPNDDAINWDDVKEDVHQVFFDDGTTELTFEDDIKALIYVISTHTGELGPEWPVEDSI